MYRWSFLHIADLRKTPDNQGVVDEDIALLAGQMEAMLTAPLIRMHWQNTMSDYCASPSDYCNKLQNFISQSVTWMSTLSGGHGCVVCVCERGVRGVRCDVCVCVCVCV